MEIMHTMSSEANAPTPKRRNYSPALKAQVVDEAGLTQNFGRQVQTGDLDLAGQATL